MANAYKWPDTIEIDGQTYRINHQFDQPNLAGSSRDRKTIFFDRQWNPMAVIDGKPVDRLPFVCRHEVAEKIAIDKGYKYPAAHKLFANPAEKHAVEKAGIKWKAYEESFIHDLHKCEHERHAHLPPTEDRHQFTDVNRKRRRN